MWDRTASLGVVPDPNAPGSFLVQGFNGVGTAIFSLWTGSNMTEAQANALMDRVVDRIDSFDPTV